MWIDSKSMSFKLTKVTYLDYRFLYDLLKERPSYANISHVDMPTWLQHCKFCESQPYSQWYVIKHKSTKLGSIYITHQNEIGIFIKREYQGKGAARWAVECIMAGLPGKYIANISPKNKVSKKFFKKMGFKLIQHTFTKESE